MFSTLSGLAAAVVLTTTAPAPQLLPTGQAITPLAAPGAGFTPLRAGIGPHPAYLADGAAAMSLSPDKRTLLVMTSGYNRYNGADGKIVAEQSQQYIFVYSLSAKGATPVQTLTVPNSFSGIAWRPDGRGFAVGGGVDDTVILFGRGKAGYAIRATIALGHNAGNGVDVKPQAAGVAYSPDGRRLLVANYYNDSVSLIDVATRKVITEQDLRPGRIDPAQSGVAGGEYPFAVTWRDNGHAWVSAVRDREIVALDVSDRLTVSRRIATVGQPTALLYDTAARRLYATEDNADRLAIIDGATDKLAGEPRVGFPEQMATDVKGKGVNPNALARMPDGRLLVTLGGINAVALVRPGADTAATEGLAPTGWYPGAVAFAANRVYVANRKSPPGPNPEGCQPKVAETKTQATACGSANQYIFQLEKAGFLQFPLPSPRSLARLTDQVGLNIGLDHAAARATADAVMTQLRSRIKHVVFVVKENRTYDQVLGDLEVGNGDPRLAILGQRLSPSHHDLARRFVTLDNYYASGEQSSTGWTWSTAARATDVLEKTAPVNYSGRGLSYEAESGPRNLSTVLPVAERRKINPAIPDDPDLLPGQAASVSPDPDDDERPGQGFLWNAALRAGLSVRNYGFSSDFIYDSSNPKAAPLAREAFKTKTVVYVPAERDLVGRSDPYFRGFDQAFPDFWNIREWMRDFGEQEKAGTVPALTLLRISHDHFGDFKTAIDGVNTVETEMADNDYALGQIVDYIAHSSVKDDTLVFVIEDDAQNGVDHIDARRSFALIAGPYVRQKAVVSTRYTTLNLLRTLEGVLGLKPLGLNDALAVPMADIFDLSQRDWDFKATASDVLRQTQLPIPETAYAPRNVAIGGCPLRTADYWAVAMRGQDFRTEDRLDTGAFNTALWHGLSSAPQPVTRDGADLSGDRGSLLHRADMQVVCPAK